MKSIWEGGERMADNKKSKGRKKDKIPKKAPKKVEEKATEEELHPKLAEFREYYDKNYKTLMIIPFAMLAIALVITVTMPPEQDIDLKGGLSIIILTDIDVDANALEGALHGRFGSDIRLRVLNNALTGETQVAVEVGGDPDKDAILAELGKQLNTDIAAGSYSIHQVNPSISASTFAGAQRAVVIAFVLMGAIIALIFREPVISGAVMLAAFSDIVESYALMSLLGIKLSMPTIAALLMLIGYSVDSDILLTTRILKRREGRIVDRIFDAMVTGLTMEATTIAAVTAILVLSNAAVLQEIATVLLLGISVDVINTWIQNAGIIKWYLEGVDE